MLEHTLLETYLREHGTVLLIDKPLSWTSFDVVSKIKSVLKYRFSIKKIKVGHAGTLDPLATGLLIVCIGKTTKSIDQYQRLTKTYRGTLCLGATTPSYDMETLTDKNYPLDKLTETQIIDAAQSFVGEQLQIPPIFSAVKIDGKRAYSYARKEKDISLAPRQIIIYQFNILSIDLPEVSFIVRCSKGTYIRALVRDFGEKVNNGAYLKQLRRESIGDFSIENSLDISNIEPFLANLPTAP